MRLNGQVFKADAMSALMATGYVPSSGIDVFVANGMEVLFSIVLKPNGQFFEVVDDGEWQLKAERVNGDYARGCRAMANRVGLATLSYVYASDPTRLMFITQVGGSKRPTSGQTR